MMKNEDWEREALKELMYLGERTQKEMEDLEDHLRILVKEKAIIEIKIPEKHETVDKTDTLPF